MKKVIRVALAALLGTAGAMTVAPTASADVDIYSTEGYHYVNGREWRTQCEPYSITHRCRTEIKATVVTYSAGRFVQNTGWAFNNLTYLQSPRETWAGNPLASHNMNDFVSGGRNWRTECDTATTGRGGCRSYIEADVIAKTPGGFAWQKQWIFNSMVRFGTVQPLPQPVTPVSPDLENFTPTPIDLADVPARIGTMTAYEADGAIIYSRNLAAETGVGVVAFGNLDMGVEMWRLGLQDSTTLGAAVCGTIPDSGEYVCVFKSAKYGHTMVMGFNTPVADVHQVTTTLVSSMS
ncbi:hypothetical protein [Tessaracoccus sp. MC1756]|uniref:hypothetical protein n=1 Tax=Tessaracoccus sp. MC1756 TaxID=2760311 RepID=UPI001600ACD5|nr:hypothetical protein [Tessaracoccus sp. MC1756]MBB1509764.1 hypothetical protein [Tessaracoccus sp. MC1756]